MHVGLSKRIPKLFTVNKARPLTRFRHTVTSPIGRVSEAGFIADGMGLQKPRIYGKYAIVYLVAGRGRYSDNQAIECPLVPGDVILVFPDIPHTYGPGENEHWSEFYIAFEGPVFDLWREMGLLNPLKPIFHVEPIPVWLKKLESILAGTRSPSFTTPLAEVCSLQKLLAEMMVESGSVDTNRKHLRWENEACTLLEADLEQDLDLAALARRMGISYAGFRKQFTQRLGQSPGRYRTSCRVDRACLLMQQSTLSNKEISDRLGFCDEFYFSRRFKQITGKSPTDFRHSLSKAR